MMDQTTTETRYLISDLADDQDMIDLVELFVGELPQRVASMKSALEMEDVETLKRLAHQLKGAAGGYGFPTITDAARVLENLTTTDKDIQKLTDEVTKIDDLCSRARAKRPEA